jgi:hypothetical protein
VGLDRSFNVSSEHLQAGPKGGQRVDGRGGDGPGLHVHAAILKSDRNGMKEGEGGQNTGLNTSTTKASKRDGQKGSVEMKYKQTTLTYPEPIGRSHIRHDCFVGLVPYV